MPAPPGIRKADWDATKAKALAVLTEKARQRHSQTIAYSELAKQIGPIIFDPHGHTFHTLLEQISMDEDGAGRGMLSVLVVYKEPAKMMPGPGFFKLARKLGRTFRDDLQFWSEEVQRVLDAHKG